MKLRKRNIESSIALATRAQWTALAGAVAAIVGAPVAVGAALDNVAANVGLEFHQESEDQAPIGAGAAWVDVDADGDDDLFAVQATGCNRLFLNDGGTFSEPDAANALGAGLCGEISRGISAADYDNDGDQDLFVTQRGQNRLLKNQFVETGVVAFIDETVAAGMDNDGARNSASSFWGDFNGDGYVDLFAGNHRDFTLAPDLVCHADYLWQNDGNGGFVDVAGPTGVGLSGDLNGPGCQLTGTFTDYDNDGDLDLAVINDFGNQNIGNRLFRNDGSDGNGGWTFTDVSDAASFNYLQAGMGIAVGDTNRDGHLDYYLSDAGKNEFALNNGDGTFTEVATEAEVEANDQEIYGSNGLVSWGNGLFDLDRDGFEDLIVTNGGAPRDKWPGGMFGADYIDNNPIYVYNNQQDGTFNELHTQLGVQTEAYFRTAAFSDFDDDGDMDFYAGNLQGLNVLYENKFGVGRHYLKVKPVGTLSDRDAIGTRISLESANGSQIRETNGGSSFLSRHSLTSHFGLNDVALVDHLTVSFLSGVETEFLDVAADATITVTEPVVAAKVAQDTFEAEQGKPIPLNITIRNYSGDSQATQLWIDYIKPDGTVRTLVGPRPLSLPGGFEFSRSISFPTGPAVPLGENIFAVRLGTYPDGAVQQEFAFAEIVPPAE